MSFQSFGVLSDLAMGRPRGVDRSHRISHCSHLTFRARCELRAIGRGFFRATGQENRWCPPIFMLFRDLGPTGHVQADIRCAGGGRILGYYFRGRRRFQVAKWQEPCKVPIIGARLLIRLPGRSPCRLHLSRPDPTCVGEPSLAYQWQRGAQLVTVRHDRD